MEAVPKLPLLSFELKVSPENTIFGTKLKQYIAEAYHEDPDSYSNEIHQLEGLRSAAVRPTSDDGGLKSMIRYFCQLRSLQSRFPMAKGQPAACLFTWKDVYASMSCSLADLQFEMACILYNIGALHTQLGASEPRNTADSLKAACTHYQNAAWAFQYLKDQYPQPMGVDISTEMMRLLQKICFAQAQECILEKSIQDTRKPSVVGAVATQVLSFYKQSIAILGPPAPPDTVYEIIGYKVYHYWHRYLSFKSSYIGCIVCLYQGMNAEEMQKMGERVAYYQQALEKLIEARKLAKHIEPTQVTLEALTFTNDVVEGKRKSAKNENEFIYHEEVPDKDLLVELKPVCLVKNLAINLNDPEVSGPDVFSRLVPIRAHETSSLYSEEKAKLLRKIVSQAEMKNTELTEFMSSLQLDQLDVIDSEQNLPQEIVDRCAAMNAKTEIIQTLVDSMNSLAEIISDVEHSLADIKTLIQEETAKEKEYQKRMGARPASIVQTELARELNKYQDAHARTNESNNVLHKAMTLHIANLKLLAQPLAALKENIPSIDNIEGLDRETMVEMRRVVGKAKEMQTQRDVLIQQLRDAITADDITSQLLARSTEPPEDIFKQELEKHTPKVKIIEQNLAAQENIINKLTSLYASYGESRRLLTDVLRKRESLINALITSYDSYEELLGKSQKGLEFYKKLSHNVNQLLARLKSTCQVQEEERAQLLARNAKKSSTPTPPPVVPSGGEVAAPVAGAVPPGGSRKLKDYLPYMKNRTPRTGTPQDAYYPDSMYPTSVRPTPLGSEDMPVQLPDGVIVPPMQGQPNPYERYPSPYAPSENAQHNYTYPMTSQAFDKPNDYGYASSYTPQQYSSQVPEQSQQIYSNPYYSATPNNSGTFVTDSQSSMQYSTAHQGNISANQYDNPTNAGQYANPTNTSQPGLNQYGNPGMSQPQTSQYVNTNQANTNPNQFSYDPYNQVNSQSDVGLSAYPNQSDLNVNFAQMQISAPKTEASNFGGDYTQTYYSVQYPQANTPNSATYSHAPQNSITSMVSAPSDYSALNYPYSSEASQHGPSTTAPYSTDQQISSGSYPVSQGYATYTQADSGVTSTTSVSNTMATAQPYTYTPEPDPSYANPALSSIDALDKPIKSHAKGEALANISYPSPYQQYDSMQNVTPQVQPNPNDPNYQTYANYPESSGFVQGYQNHPGYTFNTATGNYEYGYGSQNSVSYDASTGQNNLNPHASGNNSNYSAQGVYTSAGMCETMQSPSEEIPSALPEQQSNQQIYYNSPYGYITNTNQANQIVHASQPTSTNYGANMNQSTYMQSGQGHDTSVTYANNQVSTPKENVMEPPNFGHSQQSHGGIDQNVVDQPNVGQNVGYVREQNVENIAPTNVQRIDQSDTQSVEQSLNNPSHNVDTHNTASEQPSQPVSEPKITPETKSAFDLLSDIDFSVEQTPLKPEIKVPQISESAIKKPAMLPKMDTVRPPKEEVIERPAKRDLFSDPSLLNKFTQEVKNLKKFTESLSNVSAGGLTVLDSKWKTFQDLQNKENMIRSKTIAMQHSSSNIVTDVVPFDDSRLKLKTDPDAYINASYYKQLASWCIPLVISKNPAEEEYSIFWKAVLENKIICVLCLLSEIEMQGKSYWPTAKGQTLDLSGVKVTLDDVTCNMHYTERKLTVASKKLVLGVTHYQINVFPAKIVCSPLVLLADKILSQTFDNRLSNQLCGAWVQCGAGAGRSALFSLLVMVVCQVRAGQINLCEMLDAGCTNLIKHRSNVLEDTKYLVDAYKTALFYVQGVLCSGTTMFNGEAVSMPSGAAVLPPTPVSAAPTPPIHKQKFSRESFEEMRQSPGLKSGDMKDPLNFLDPLWSLKKK